MIVNVSDYLRDRAAQSGDAVALAESFGEHRQVTWQQLDADADAIARWLSGRGLVAGHRVGLCLGNRIEFVAAYLGALRAGLVAVPMNPRSAVGEFVRMIADSGSRLLFCDESTVHQVRSAADNVEAALAAGAELEPQSRAVVPGLVVAGPGAEGSDVPYETLLTAGGGPAPPSPTDPEALAALLYTAGTSGRPRGVMLTHRALVANVEQVAAVDPPPIGPDDVVLGLLPLFHVYGLNCVLSQTIRRGARLLLVDRFDADATLDLVAEHGVTNLPLAPPVVGVWAGRPDLRAKLSHVRTVLSGASPLDPDLAAAFTESCGVAIEEGYGLTETAPVLTTTLAGGRAPGGGPKAGSVGRALDGVDIRIVDGTGQDVAAGDPGEIRVRGANLFSGYWPDGTAGPDADGWYATGDVGLVDTDGDLRLVDRLGELVIVSGFNVYPSEVEDVLTELDAVAEAAVIGVPDAQTGEAVRAFVVPAADDQDETDLVESLRGHLEVRLARFKWPGEITVVTGLPHSVTGKVAKGRLRAQTRGDVLGLR